MLKDAAAHRPASRLASDVMIVASLARKKLRNSVPSMLHLKKKKKKLNKDRIYVCNDV